MALATTSASTTRHMSSPEAQLVSFKLYGETFAIPILDVREIIHMPDITPVPQAPSFVEGVINLRGQIIPIVDLRHRFGLQSNTKDSETRIIIVELNSAINLGLIVDSVSEVERIPYDSILPPPSIISGCIGAEYIKSISNYEDKMVIHIDLRKVFSVEEINVLEAAAQ